MYSIFASVNGIFSLFPPPYDTMRVHTQKTYKNIFSMPLKKSSHNDDLRSKILRDHAFGTKSRALILLDVFDRDIQVFLLEVGKTLDIAFVVTSP